MDGGEAVVCNYDKLILTYYKTTTMKKPQKFSVIIENI